MLNTEKNALCFLRNKLKREMGGSNIILSFELLGHFW